MTRLFCPISQYQRGLMLNNKIYCLLFISNLILAGFWAFGQPVAFIWMTLSQCKQQKIFENVLSPLQNQAPGAAQAVSPVLFLSLALAAHSWNHGNGKVTQHVHTSSNRQHLEINTKASVLLMQKEEAKQHVNFLLFHHVFSCDLLHYLPVIFC